MCIRDSGYLAECQQGNRLASAATGLWIAAGTFGVVGLASMLTAHFLKKTDAIVTRPASGQPISVRVLPSIVPNGAMVHAAIDF